MTRVCNWMGCLTMMAGIALSACAVEDAPTVSMSEDENRVPPNPIPCEEQHWTTTSTRETYVPDGQICGYSAPSGGDFVVCNTYTTNVWTDTYGHNILCPSGTEIEYLVSSTPTASYPRSWSDCPLELWYPFNC